jgi:hypothetical protein
VLFLLEPTTAPPLPVDPNDLSLAIDSGKELGGTAIPVEGSVRLLLLLGEELSDYLAYNEN